MFNFVHEKRRFVQIVLVLIILPFTFWGMDSFNKSGDAESLATVGGEKISQQEFDQELRQQQDSMREAMGNAYDPALLSRPRLVVGTKLDLPESGERLRELEAAAAGERVLGMSVCNRQGLEELARALVELGRA